VGTRPASRFRPATTVDAGLDAGTWSSSASRAPAFVDAPFRCTILAHCNLHWDHCPGTAVFFSSAGRPELRAGGDALSSRRRADPIADACRAMSRRTSPSSPTGCAGRWKHLGIERYCTISLDYRCSARDVRHKGGRALGYAAPSFRGASLAYLPDVRSTTMTVRHHLPLRVTSPVLPRGAPFLAQES